MSRYECFIFARGTFEPGTCFLPTLVLSARTLVVAGYREPGGFFCKGGLHSGPEDGERREC